MTLVFIDQDKLSVSKTNMRYGKKAPDVSDILPTVRKRGVIQTLLVRPNCEDGQFEIVAGSRRFHAARIVAAETGEAEPLPCRILPETDDAAAVEASMIENLGIGCDDQHRVCGGAEQQVIDHRLVPPGDVGDLGRHREHNVEVADRQQIGLTRGQPDPRGSALALGTMPVAAGVVGDPPVPAVVAGLDVTSQRSGAAILDRRHGLELAEAQMPGVG